MAEGLRHVIPGERVRFSAGLHNAVVDVVRASRQGQHDQSAGTSRSVNQTGIILIKNDSGEDRARFDILGISGILIHPTDNLQAFENAPSFVGDLPDTSAHFGRFVVLQEPLKDGAIGRAVISGMTKVRVRMLPENVGQTRADIVNEDASCLGPHPMGAAHIIWIDDTTDPYDDRQEAVIRLGNPAYDTWPGVVTGNAEIVAGKQWKYEVEEIEPLTDDTYRIKDGGRTCLISNDTYALNWPEFGHTTDYLAGVDTGAGDYPSGMALRPIGGGGTDNTHKYDAPVIVMPYPCIDGDTGAITIRNYIWAMNSHDGTC